MTQPGGDPNQNAIIRLRGQTSLTGGQTPLIVLDGVPLDDPSQFSNIPAGDIASYDVLKDASALQFMVRVAQMGLSLLIQKKVMPGKTKLNIMVYWLDKQAKKFDLLTCR